MTTTANSMVRGIEQAGILAATLITLTTETNNNAAELSALAPQVMRTVYADRLAALDSLINRPFRRSQPGDVQRVAGQVHQVYSDMVSEALGALTLAVILLAGEKRCSPEQVVGLLVAAAKEGVR